MKTTKFFLTFLIGLLLCVPLHQADAQTVDIPDANLRTAIESALGLSPGDPITETQMATLTELSVTVFSRKNVKDLTGLEHATGLTKLTLQGAFSHSSPDKIVDISLLSGLTQLTYLNLERNKIEDISPLAGLRALEILNLFTNPITDISILTTANFPNLKYLNIADTWVRDFSVLDPGHWTTKFNTDRTTDPEDDTAGSALLICNSALENWYDINDLGSSPSTDQSRLAEQLNKPTCAPVFRIESTGDNTSVRLVVDADADLTANYVTLTYVYRYRKSGDSWPTTSTDTATPQWTGGFVNPPSGEDGAPNYQGVIEGKDVGEGVIQYATDDITGLDPSAVYHFQVFGSFLQGGNIRNIYPPGSEIQCWSTSGQSVQVCPPDPTSRRDPPFRDPSPDRPKSRSLPRVVLYPSHVAMDRIIFNEFRNAADDTYDWIELKNISDEPVSLKEWEVSQVLPHVVSPAAPLTEIYAMDRDIAAFPDTTLPPGGVLLIVNTDPSETDLIRGQNLENPDRNPDRLPQYLIAPEMKLPNHPYLLILRSARDQNGKWDGFEDLLGNYYKGDAGYRTQIWPLRDTWVHTGTAASFTAGDVWKRVMTQRSFTYKGLRRVPEARGYLEGAWTLSEYESGLGYAPDASRETSLGTPGYPEDVIRTQVVSGEVSISEVMYATDERASLSQWIELYNASSEKVDLEGWKLVLEVRDSRTAYHYTTLTFKPLDILPNQTVLLVSRNARSSGNIPKRRIYNVYRQNGAAFRRGEGANKILGSEGFALRLISPDGTLVDMVGNLDGWRTEDTPKWELPAGWTETGGRTSLIRRYADGVPLRGNLSSSWVRGVETGLLGAYTYWGLASDNGTPGYRQGSPLPVTLSSFRADRTETGVVVKWTTASEMENAGFYVLRCREGASDFDRITPSLIAGAGTTAEGQTYTYRDTTASANVPYSYRLEEVSLSGERRAVATVRLRGHVSAANKLLWKWADVKAGN